VNFDVARQVFPGVMPQPAAERFGVSVCATCGTERVDPVPLTGDPDSAWWFGACAVCQELRWFCLLRLITLDAGAPASKGH